MTTGFPDTEWEPRGMMVHDTFHEALQACVAACGGNKSVASMLWPTKDVHAARDTLLACLNPHRKEKLDLDEVVFVMRAARDRGCHAGMEYLAARLSYAPPVPVARADESDELHRQFLKTAAQMQRISDRIFDMAQREATPAHPSDLGALRSMRSDAA